MNCAGLAAHTTEENAANTILEQISDWLTKILVGASLVQFRAIKDEIVSLTKAFAPALGNEASAAAVALCIMGVAACWGFFFSYLLTRLWLPRALGRAEHDEAVQKRAVERETALSDLEQRIVHQRLHFRRIAAIDGLHAPFTHLHQPITQFKRSSDTVV